MKRFIGLFLLVSAVGLTGCEFEINGNVDKNGNFRVVGGSDAGEPGEGSAPEPGEPAGAVTAENGDSCGEIAECIVECEDEACAEECFNEGNEDAQDALIELLNCYDSEWDCAEEEQVCLAGSIDDGAYDSSDSDDSDDSDWGDDDGLY
jgi:hypothetical protein